MEGKSAGLISRHAQQSSGGLFGIPSCLTLRTRVVNNQSAVEDVSCTRASALVGYADALSFQSCSEGVPAGISDDSVQTHICLPLVVVVAVVIVVVYERDGTLGQADYLMHSRVGLFPLRTWEIKNAIVCLEQCALFRVGQLMTPVKEIALMSRMRQATLSADNESYLFVTDNALLWGKECAVVLLRDSQHYTAEKSWLN